MNCTDVRENLSAYIDEMLDKQIRDMMASHLETCKACRQELASMRTLVEELGDMSDIKAPEDFLDTLHERLETESFWTRIKEMLFVPAQIKIPLEFATISIVGVLIFSLYSVYSPQDHLASLPQDLAMKSTAGRAVVHETESVSPAQRPLQENARDETFEYVPAAKQAPIELALVLPQKVGIGDLGLAEDKEEIPVRAAAVPASRQKDSGQTGYKASATDMALQKSDADKDKETRAADTTGPAAKKQADVSTQESPPLYEFQGVVHKLHELIGLSGGRILSEEHDREDQQERVILAEVPAGQYGNFIEKITDIARFKETPPAIPDDREAPVLVRIRLVPGQ